jgi:Cyclin, N-terminal domain
MLREFELLTDEQLENSPSRRDGIPREREDHMRRQATDMIKRVAPQLKLPLMPMHTAIMFCQRYYAYKSFLKNDRVIMAMASIFLAGKVRLLPHGACAATSRTMWLGLLDCCQTR